MKQLKEDFKIEFYDEYQRLQRYRNGYVLFILLTFVLVLNGASEYEWGVTPNVEMFMLGIIFFIVYNLLSVFTHSYFKKKENVRFALVMALFIGSLWGLMAWEEYQVNPIDFIDQGKVGQSMHKVIMSLNFLLMPLVLGLRVFGEKIKERREASDL